MNGISTTDIFNCTDGGLQIIVKLYPDAADCVSKKNKAFKVRDEKTPSARLREYAGVWKVTDFGGDGKPKNAIDLVMIERNCSFKEAIEWICNSFMITSEAGVSVSASYDYENRLATPEEETGKWYFQFKDSPSSEDIEHWFAEQVIKEEVNIQRAYDKSGEKYNDKTYLYSRLVNCLKKYYIHALESYTVIKADRTAHVFKSNENYPIFCMDYGDWKKLIQPKSKDKSRRFLYYGEKPADFINGLKQCKNAVMALSSAAEIEKEIDEESDREAKPTKIEEIILCSGERDATNVAAIGYEVIWLNSESAKISFDQYKVITSQCVRFYNLPDIDATGKKQAHILALSFLDLHTIQLPNELAEKRDFRGNPCKDVRDYLKYFKTSDFSKLLKAAMPYRFWDTVAQYNKAGEFTGYNYQFNNVYAYNFLMANGFYRFETPNEKDGFIYIHIEENRVKEVRPVDIKNFINLFLEKRKSDEIKLRNTFYKSNQLSENSLSNLHYKEIDFSDHDEKSQWFFFKNRTWCVSAEDIKVFKPQDVDKVVWIDEVMPYVVDKTEEPFTITQDEESGEYDIVVNNNNCLFLNFMINTCRMHWRDELEVRIDKDKQQEYIEANKFNIAGPNLSEEQKREQKHHLINRIYALGYLLSKHKQSSKPWAVWAMENKVSEEGDSQGGSGKSIFLGVPRHFLKNDILNGRDTELTTNKHIFERITEHHDYCLVDDCHQYLRFDFFYPATTGDMTVNPKNNKQYTIKFKDSPKFAFSSNFSPYNLNASTARRLLFTAFSDYYHDNTDKKYNETRSPRDEFGKDLFTDFTESEWNLALNTCVYALKFFLTINDKINPPMEDVGNRNLVSKMGLAFLNWADVTFSPEGGNLDVLIPKQEALLLFMYLNKTQKTTTTHKFTKSIESYCELRGYKLNPETFKNSDGRIIRRVDNQSTELFYISTGKEPNDTIKRMPLPRNFSTGNSSSNNDQSTENDEPKPF